MNNVEYISRIRKFIENDELDSALMALSALLQNSDKLDEAIHQSGRYENIRKQIRLGIVSHSEANLTQNQIRVGLLDLLREIEKQGEEPTMFREIERALSIVNSKNMVVSSNISANNIHIGDTYTYLGTSDWGALHNKVFIFHNESEREWVNVNLIPKLKSLGLEIHLDSRKPTLETFSELARTVASCKAALLVFPKNPSRYEHNFFNSLVEEGLKNLIPIRLDDHDVPNFFSEHIALSSREDSSEHFRQLFTRLDPKNFPIFPELNESLIEISAMPNGGEHIHLFGRQRELQILDDAWAKREHRVLCFVAQGGTGKSALFNRWLADMRRDHFRGAGRVLATSFYSQGTGERVTSADQFINFALQWFGERDFEQRSPWDKGKRLAQLVSEHRTLLVLDGLEPLQESGAVDTGKVKDPALFTLIRDLAKRNEGLCVITSRLRLGGLERQTAGIRQEDLEQISDEAGKHILRFAGIRGDDAALAGAVRQFGNHAFAVNLLGAWLYAQPGHRVEAAAAIADLPEVPLERGRHPRRVIAAFEKLLREKGLDEEVQLLRFLGLFDRPVTEEAIAQLHPFQNMYITLDSLWMLKLIYREKRHPILRKNKEDMVDCHPLIREHYSEVLAKEEPEIWQKCHARLYEYYKGLPERLYGKFLPDTLEEMEPLILAMGHGCEAGFYYESYSDILWKRIRREQQQYSTAALGAFTTELSIFKYYFKKPWDELISSLPKDFQYGCYSAVGYILMALGEFPPAFCCFEKAVVIARELISPREVALSSNNVMELYFFEGSIGKAMAMGEKLLEFEVDRKSKDSVSMVTSLSRFGYAAYLYGGNKNTIFEIFESAESLQNSFNSTPFLYSINSFYFCEFLLSIGREEDVIRRSSTNLDLISSKNLPWTLSIGLENLSLGKAYSNLRLGSPLKYFDMSIEYLRKAGNKCFIPLPLLARAAYYRLTQNFFAAEEDLEEVLDLSEPNGMRLHLTDYHIEIAHIRLAQARVEDARLHITKAAQLIAETEYYLRANELVELSKLIET